MAISLQSTEFIEPARLNEFLSLFSLCHTGVEWHRHLVFIIICLNMAACEALTWYRFLPSSRKERTSSGQSSLVHLHCFLFKSWHSKKVIELWEEIKNNNSWCYLGSLLSYSGLVLLLLLLLYSLQLYTYTHIVRVFFSRILN